MTLSNDSLPYTDKMPAIFVGHGSPLNAVEANRFHRHWSVLGQTLVRPHGILSVSAHWLTPGKTLVTRMKTPPTLHDFAGFPVFLRRTQYPAPGNPALADRIIASVKTTRVLGDLSWGLDHGTWSALLPMYPEADIPVVQLSIDLDLSPAQHFELARELTDLRHRGVMVMGSGNMVHNLSMMSHRPPYEWALAVDERIKTLIDSGNDRAVLDMPLGEPLFARAHPSPDHFLPLIYVLGVRDPDDDVTYFNAEIDLASISMRGVVFS